MRKRRGEERDYSEAFNEFPDVSKEYYPVEQRFNLDGGQALDWFEQVEHPGWKTEAAYALVELAYGRAYETGEEEEERFAMKVHDEVAKPYIEFCFGSGEELPQVDITPYRDGLEDIEATTKTYGNQARLSKVFPSPKCVPHSLRNDHGYIAFAEDLNAQVDPAEYDVVYTAWSKGIPLLDIAADRLELDKEQQVVIRYSPTLKDTDVQSTSVMQERAAEEAHTDFLFVDDVLMKGTTAENAYEWAKEQGAERVDAFIMNVMDQSPHFDEKKWKGIQANSLFSMVGHAIQSSSAEASRADD